uniref:Uncharacterized protein n=2 Tax=Trichuris muris TaxID=70415 RepID=A0A5S6Q0L7_TRIMR
MLLLVLLLLVTTILADVGDDEMHRRIERVLKPANDEETYLILAEQSYDNDMGKCISLECEEPSLFFQSTEKNKYLKRARLQRRKACADYCRQILKQRTAFINDMRQKVEAWNEYSNLIEKGNSSLALDYWLSVRRQVMEAADRETTEKLLDEFREEQSLIKVWRDKINEHFYTCLQMCPDGMDRPARDSGMRQLSDESIVPEKSLDKKVRECEQLKDEMEREVQRFSNGIGYWHSIPIMPDEVGLHMAVRKWNSEDAQQQRS